MVEYNAMLILRIFLCFLLLRENQGYDDFEKFTLSFLLLLSHGKLNILLLYYRKSCGSVQGYDDKP